MSASAADGFIALVAAEITAVRAFVALLNDETGVLRGNDAGALERITAAKEKLAGELEELGKKRSAFFAAIGLTQNAAAVNNWLASQPPAFAEAWRELMRLAEIARELNLANGQCIALLSRDTRIRLAALTGREESAYAPKGQAASSFSSPSATGFRIRDNA